MSKRKTKVIWKLGKKGFTFLVDGVVNSKTTVFYTTKRALAMGTKRFMAGKPYTVDDQTGVSYRGRPVKK